jgi:hypothetical protein
MSPARAASLSAGLIVAIGLTLAAFVGLAKLFVGQARAHSFYPWECCSSQDCWPMGLDADAREPDPVETRAGWRLADGIVIPFALTRKSPDGRFHVCRRGGAADGAVIQPSERPICLWAPVPTY